MQNQSFDHLLGKIAEVLQMAYDNAHKSIPKEKEAEINAQLDNLEKQMGELNKRNKKFIEKANLNDYKIQAMLDDENSEIISPKGRQILKKAEELKAEATAASKDVIKAANDLNKSGIRLTDKKETKMKSRKGKFRSMGGVKNWKAL